MPLSACQTAYHTAAPVIHSNGRSPRVLRGLRCTGPASSVSKRVRTHVTEDELEDDAQSAVLASAARDMQALTSARIGRTLDDYLPTLLRAPPLLA
jgi:hypothetical protein